MRHKVEKKRIGSDTAHTKSLLRGLSESLIIAGKVETTLAKAKALRPYIENLVTKAKTNNVNTVKYLRGKLYSRESTDKLLKEISPKFVEKPGGYTRIVKLGTRKGDRAKIARIEFTEGTKK